MERTDNRLLVRRYYEEIVTTGGVDRLPGFIASDYAEIHGNRRHPLELKGAIE